MASNTGSPGGCKPPSAIDDDDDEDEDDCELVPEPDDDDDDEEEDDEEDDGDGHVVEEKTGDEREEKRAAGSSSSKKAIATVDTIEEDFFLTYGKKTFGVPAHAFVLLGSPYECADGEKMGIVLASKSPEEWLDVKSRHVYVLHAEGHDFLYVCFFVAGSPTESIDKRRLQPVHRPVCKGLVERFNNSTINEELKLKRMRLLSFITPPESCGPQITPGEYGSFELALSGPF